jgi:hypothetical protein
MMKYLAFLAALIVTFGALPIYAAECRYEEDKIDTFTKQQVRLTKPTYLTGQSSNPRISIAASKVGPKHELLLELLVSRYSAEMTPVQLRDDAIVIPAGANLLVLLADETVVKLPASTERTFNARYLPPNAESNSGSSQHRALAVADIAYDLDAAAIAALSAQDAVALRVEVADSVFDIAERNHDITLRKKFQSRLRDMVSCL